MARTSFAAVTILVTAAAARADPDFFEAIKPFVPTSVVGNLVLTPPDAPAHVLMRSDSLAQTVPPTAGPASAGPSAGSQPAAGAGAGELDAGTDPSKAKTRFNIYHEFYRIQNGWAFNTTTANFIFPIFGGGGTLGFNIPFTYAEIPAARPFGLGDMYARLILMPTKWDSVREVFEWPIENIIPVTGLDVYFPTAENTLLFDREASKITTLSLGTGKYSLAPLLGFAWQVTKEWSVIPVYFHQFSVAGDQRFSNINQGKARLFIQYQDLSGWYFKPEFQLVTNYVNNNQNDFYVAPEVGKVFKGGTVFYVKPGYGFIRNPDNRDWGIEADFRITF